MGDEPVRELVEKIMFFVGEMGSSSSKYIKEFDNYQWDSYNKREDLFYNYDGFPQHLSFVSDYYDSRISLCNENEGNILHDLSGSGNDGTIYGATWSTDVPYKTG